MKTTVYIFLFCIAAFDSFAQNKFTIDQNNLKKIPSENFKRKDASFFNFPAFSTYEFLTSDLLSQPASLIPIYDSIFGWQWDTLIAGWKLRDKTTNFVYDAANNPISFLGQNWSGAAWENDVKGLYTYDANNNLTGVMFQDWNGLSWENSNQYLLTYDVNNNPTSELDQSWNGTVWESTSKYIYTYDANNNQTSQLGQIWYNSAWKNDFKRVYTYDANNNQTSELEQNWNDSIMTWVNSFQRTYMYDINNNQTGELDQQWNGTTWVNAYQTTNTYDVNNNEISSLPKSWNGSSWVNFYFITKTYDINNNKTGSLKQRWNGSSWINDGQSIAAYDANNILRGSSYKSFNNSGTAILYGDSSYNYFHTVTGVNDLHNADYLQVYPNPTAGIVEVSNLPSATCSLEIYSIMGEKAFSSTINRKQEMVNLSSRPNGIYFLHIKTENNLTIKKLVINK